MRVLIHMTVILLMISLTVGCKPPKEDQQPAEEVQTPEKAEAPEGESPLKAKAGGPPGGGGGACGSCSDVTSPNEPVILVHGRNDTSARWDDLVTDFTSRGYTEGTNLFRFDATTECGDNSYCSVLSGHSASTVNESYALCLKAYIDTKVPTGQVDIITHSQGSITARYYSRFLDTSKVDDLVLMSGPNQGTNNCALAGACTGINPETCPDSAVMRKLNGVSPEGDGSNDETPDHHASEDVHYAVVVSDKDNVIQPWCSGELILNPDQQQADDVTCKGQSQFTLDTAADRCQISSQHLTIPTEQDAIDFAYCMVNTE